VLFAGAVLATRFDASWAEIRGSRPGRLIAAALGRTDEPGTRDERG